jgi:hypothetical protein
MTLEAEQHLARAQQMLAAPTKAGEVGDGKG